MLQSAVAVDPEAPVFSNPTAITNPLFPISRLTHVVHLGAEGGDRLRFEMTRLPEIRTVEWEGRLVSTTVSQLVAYREGRLVEVARDFQAQADDGSVWHFGEESANYHAGVLVDHEGSWLAGRDGRPVLVMPARPHVGAVFRSQATPDQVGEVTVQSTDLVVDGPRGPVGGGMVVQERLGDGTLEDKTFAPGYGELHMRVPAQDELSSVAVAIPADAHPGPVPAALAAISTEAMRILQGWDGSGGARTSQEWADARAAAQQVNQTWVHHQPREGNGLLTSQMGEGLADLVAAVGARRTARLHRAATDVANASLDLQLRYRQLADVDRDRLRLWAHQVVVDAAAGEMGALDGDVVVLDAMSARTSPATSHQAPLGAALADLRSAIAARDLARASGIARMLALT